MPPFPVPQQSGEDLPTGASIPPCSGEPCHPAPKPEQAPGASDPTKTNSPLTGAHQRTYQSIFEHPVWHNLCWHEVRSLFRHLGQTETKPDGSMKVTCHGQSLVLHPPHNLDVATTDELRTLREFLERIELAPTADHPRPKETD